MHYIKADDSADAIYFSFVTLTTVGFGDVLPISQLAKTLTWFEVFLGQCYLAVIIGQLVGKYVAQVKSK